MFKSIRALLGEEKGSCIPLFGISALVLMLTSGVALDFTRSVRHLERAQNSMDAAALAVASEIASFTHQQLASLGQESSNNTTLEGQKLRKVAHDHFHANHSAVDEFDIEFETKITPVTERKFVVTVNVSGQTPTSFLKIANHASIPWSSSASSVVEVPSMELAIVADISVSMHYFDILKMKTALKNLIDSVFKSGKANDMNKVSLLPFAESVNFGMGYKPWLDNTLPPSFAEEFHGCFGPEFNPASKKIEYGYTQPYKYLPLRYSNKFGYPFCPSDKSKVELFSSDPVALKTRIDGLVKAYGTGSGIGTKWGMRTLLPSWRGRFLETQEYPRDFSDNGEKFLILLTDGRPVQFDVEGDGKDSGVTWRREQEEVAADAFVKACNAIKEQEGTIHVYAIGYRFDTADAMTKQNLKDCVHGNGKFYEANRHNLTDVFADISREMTRVRLGS